MDGRNGPLPSPFRQVDIRAAYVVSGRQIYEVVIAGRVSFCGLRDECDRYIQVRSEKAQMFRNRNPR